MPDSEQGSLVDAAVLVAVEEREKRSPTWKGLMKHARDKLILYVALSSVSVACPECDSRHVTGCTHPSGGVALMSCDRHPFLRCGLGTASRGSWLQCVSIHIIHMLLRH